MRRCSKCGLVKPLSEFGKSTICKSGYCSRCKKCKAEYWRQYLRNYPDAYKKFSILKERWRIKNLARFREVNKKWRKNNPKKVIEMRKRYDKKLRSTLEGQLLARERRRRSNKQQLSILSRKISKRMSFHIWRSLKHTKNGKRWETITGYTVTDLQKHLESQFQDGMSWDNYGKWHIDHKIPVSRFKYESFNDIEFKKCWSLENLQPLWKKDNMSKSSKTMEEWSKCKEGIV